MEVLAISPCHICIYTTYSSLSICIMITVSCFCYYHHALFIPCFACLSGNGHQTKILWEVPILFVLPEQGKYPSHFAPANYCQLIPAFYWLVPTKAYSCSTCSHSDTTHSPCLWLLMNVIMIFIINTNHITYNLVVPRAACKWGNREFACLCIFWLLANFMTWMTSSTKPYCV